MFEKDGLKKIYKFDHSKSNVIEALGIKEERLDDMLHFIENLDGPKTKTSLVMQGVLNSEELSNVEKIFLLYALGRQRESREDSPISNSYNKKIGNINVVSIGEPPEEIKNLLQKAKSIEDIEEILHKIKSLKSQKRGGCNGECKECEE